MPGTGGSETILTTCSEIAGALTGRAQQRRTAETDACRTLVRKVLHLLQTMPESVAGMVESVAVLILFLCLGVLLTGRTFLLGAPPCQPIGSRFFYRPVT